MPAQTKQTGNHGEQLAQQHLRAKGYEIIAANWRCKVGEIDIVAQQGDTVVFVEVRTRRGDSTEPAFASITPAKKQKMLRAAYAYSAGSPSDAYYRIDVIAVALPDSAAPIIRHMESALDW